MARARAPHILRRHRRHHGTTYFCHASQFYKMRRIEFLQQQQQPYICCDVVSVSDTRLGIVIYYTNRIERRLVDMCERRR